MTVQCDHCNKQFEKKMFCSSKCRVYSHRKKMDGLPVIEQLKEVQENSYTGYYTAEDLTPRRPLTACTKHHGSFTCGCS